MNPLTISLQPFLFVLLSFLICSPLLNSTVPSPQNSPRTQIDSGILLGTQSDGVFVFKGIPYAAPPVGNLRWEAPQSPASWQGERDATKFGNACIQPAGLSEQNGGDPGQINEDCLYLNVWTPTLDASAKLPVMFWIHGGGYVFGSGAVPVYDGQALAKRGVVFVTINYRLGPLGFFSHASLERAHPHGPANFALLDQIAALHWVQRNISRFGGNPQNVTIFGQSAGAKSVMALFASPLARGLFERGASLSQYGLPDAPLAKASQTGAKIATALGFSGASATIEQLRGAPAEKFAALMKDQSFSLGPVPIAGDSVLPQSIQSTFEAGREAALPLIIGNTSDDSSVVAAFGVNPAQIIQKIRGAGMAVRLLYPGVKDENILARQAARDLVFTMPVRWVADRHSLRAKTWRYYFDYVPAQERANSPNGVAHGNEIAFVLATGGIVHPADGQFTPQDLSYEQSVSEYWLNFAKSGVPQSPGFPAWTSSSTREDKTLVFGDSITAQTNFMRARLNILLTGAKLANSLTSNK